MRVSMDRSALGWMLLPLVATAAATPNDTKHGPGLEAELIAEGYEIYPATFTGEFGPDGETMSFNGTIQSVMEQVRAINPDYSFNSTASFSDLEARAMDGWRDGEVARKECNTGNFARGYYVADGVGHLRRIRNEKFKLRAKGCARIGCKKNAAIFVCWDPNEYSPEEYVKDWGYVADYASGIAAGQWCDRIMVPQDPWTVYLVRGKVWDPKGMAVRVGEDRC